MKIRVVLYTRAGCGLCNEAKAELAALSATVPLALEEIDITSDPALERDLFDRIPVIVIGSQRLEAPIDPRQLEQAVRRAARSL